MPVRALSAGAFMRFFSWIVALVIASPAAASPPAQDTEGQVADRSPATGHAAVIAQGVATPSDEEVAWRVALERADVPRQSEASPRGGGFVLADDGVVGIVDQRGRVLTQLASGEAAWVGSEAPTALVSLDDRAANYFNITLEPAESVNDAQGASAGTPFPTPAGDAFDVALVRDVVTRNEVSDVRTGIAPGILLVTSGSVSVETAGGEPVEVTAGDTVDIEGEVVVSGASRAPATFVVATIASAIPARVSLGDTAVPTPTPTPQIVPRATVAIVAFVCPPGYDGESPAIDCSETPAADVEFTATAPGGLAQTGVIDDTGLLEFRGLQTGQYVFAAGVPGDFASSWVRCLNLQGEDIARRHATNQVALRLAAGDQITCSWFIIPVDARGEDPEPAPPSLVSASAFICPVAYDGGDYEAVCLEPAAGVEFVLSSNGVSVESVVAGPAGELAFAPVAAGDYVLGAMVPGDFASSRVRCVNDAGENIAERAAINQIALALPNGAIVACDWYIVPEDARGASAVVGIAAFVCPPGFDGDYGAVCVDPADGVEFSITANDQLVQANVVGPGGVVNFGDLAAGDYVLIAGIPGDFASSRVRCLNSAGDDITRRFATNQIAVSVLPGDSVACNWYIVPTDEGE